MEMSTTATGNSIRNTALVDIHLLVEISRKVCGKLINLKVNSPRRGRKWKKKTKNPKQKKKKRIFFLNLKESFVELFFAANSRISANIYFLRNSNFDLHVCSHNQMHILSNCIISFITINDPKVFPL